MGYDIFICHATENDDWADTFAANLQSQGYAVYNDATAGRGSAPWPEKLHRAASEVSVALVLMAGRAYEKGWVRQEVNFFLTRKNGPKKDLLLIPVIVGEVDAAAPYPFMEADDHIDFRPPADYRTAFRTLIRTIRGEEKGAPEPWAGPLDLPAAARRGNEHQTATAVDTVLRRLGDAPVLILLSQSNALSGGFSDTWTSRASTGRRLPARIPSNA